ncbi:MAG: hypothetical protein AAEJ52_01235 [Myxococcota bacterium]
MTVSGLKPRRFALRAFALGAIGALLIGLSLVSTATAQNLLLLTPAQSHSDVGTPDVALDLEIDFAEVTIGGGIEVNYDATRLEFVSFTFSGDPNFGLKGPADGDQTQPLEIGAGWVVFEPPFGVSGLHTIGTFLFRAIGNGSAAVSTTESPINPGPYYSPNSPAPLVVSFNNAAIDVGAAVPTLGMFGRLVCCSLLSLAGIRMVGQRTQRVRCSNTGSR